MNKKWPRVRAILPRCAMEDNSALTQCLVRYVRARQDVSSLQWRSVCGSRSLSSRVPLPLCRTVSRTHALSRIYVHVCRCVCNSICPTVRGGVAWQFRVSATIIREYRAVMRACSLPLLLVPSRRRRGGGIALPPRCLQYMFLAHVPRRRVVLLARVIQLVLNLKYLNEISNNRRVIASQ